MADSTKLDQALRDLIEAFTELEEELDEKYGDDEDTYSTAVIEGLENYAETKQPGMNDRERIARSAAAAVARAVNKHQGRGIVLTNDEVLQMAIDNYNSRWPFGGPKIPTIRYGAQTLPSARGYDI